MKLNFNLMFGGANDCSSLSVKGFFFSVPHFHVILCPSGFAGMDDIFLYMSSVVRVGYIITIWRSNTLMYNSKLNPLAYTDVRETAGLARSINTQPAVRRSEPSMSFAFNSSLLSVDGMTYLIPFES